MIGYLSYSELDFILGALRVVMTVMEGTVHCKDSKIWQPSRRDDDNGG